MGQSYLNQNPEQSGKNKNCSPERLGQSFSIQNPEQSEENNDNGFKRLERNEKSKINIFKYVFQINGNFSQNSVQMNNITRNTQCTTMSLYSIIYALCVKNPSNWVENDLDTILLIGDSAHSLLLHKQLNLVEHKDRYDSINEFSIHEKYLNMDHITEMKSEFFYFMKLN